MVNISEQPINAVMINRLKTLISLGQKARSRTFSSMLRMHGQDATGE